MEAGQVFKIDAEAAKDLGNDDLEGREYAITKTRGNITDVEVRASQFKDGKPSRGRPRRFPRSVVARLLGETSDPSLQAVEEAADVAVDDEPTVEELEEKAEELIAASETETDDEPW